MLEFLNSLSGFDLPSILIGFGVGLIPSLGFLILRGMLFEYQEWRKRKQEMKQWFDEVERKANGVQRAWHYSGPHPGKADRERTIEEMDELTDELKTHRRHQNATDEMVETMNDIIERWDNSRGIIQTQGRKQPYLMRGEYISADAEDLKQQLHRERQGWIRGGLSKLAARTREQIQRVREWRYKRNNIPLPYDLYQELRTHLSEQSVSEFVNEEKLLLVEQEFTTEAIHYQRDENEYYPVQIDYDLQGEPVVEDKLPGKTIPEHLLLPRLREAESVDTMEYSKIVPDGQTFKELKQSVDS